MLAQRRCSTVSGHLPSTLSSLIAMPYVGALSVFMVEGISHSLSPFYALPRKRLAALALRVDDK